MFLTLTSKGISPTTLASFSFNLLCNSVSLGNCCSKCGYNKNTSALEFHHLEPEHKDFHFGSTKTTNIDKIRKELDKCILVCANCHREIHYPQNNKTN